MKRLLPSLLLAFFVPVAAMAAPFTTVYVFGDSLSDGGNVYQMTGQPPAPYYQGHISNVPVAVEQMAGRLGVSLVPSLLGGTNYAVGGAATGPVPISPATSCPGACTDNTTPALNGTGMGQQVVAFLATMPAFDPVSSLFVVWGGANNFFINPSLPVAQQAVVDLANEVNALYMAGAQNFLVPNLPDLSLTPFGRSLPVSDQLFLQALSVGFNAGLNQAMNQVSAFPGMNLVQFDTFGYLNHIVANPGAFGFTNVTDRCLDAGIVCATPDQYLFWDDVHPTARGHQLLGDEFATAVPEPSMMILFVAGCAAALRRRCA